MTFKQAAVPNFYQIAGQTAIVPQHIWSAYTNPVTQVVKAPVGTGPFTMSQCTGQNIKFSRNPNYWQKGLAVPRHRQLPGVPRQRPGEPIPGDGPGAVGRPVHPQHRHVLRRQGSHATTSTGSRRSRTSTSGSTSRGRPLDNKLVRQAFAYAIDRANVSQKGEYGYEPPGNQTGVLSPTFDSWIDQGQAATVRLQVRHRPRRPACSSRPATRRAARATTRTRQARGCRSRSSTSPATRTGSRRCR